MYVIVLQWLRPKKSITNIRVTSVGKDVTFAMDLRAVWPNSCGLKGK